MSFLLRYVAALPGPAWFMANKRPLFSKAYDLPSPQPIAENLNREEAARFEDMGFHVIAQGDSLAYSLQTQHSEAGQIALALIEKRRRRQAKQNRETQ